MIKYTEISKSFGELVAVNKLNLNIETGTILGFLGPNGAGKTTTIKMSCGLIKPTYGEIEAFGVSINRNRREYIKNIGAVLEGNRNIYWRLTPIENMEYFAGLRGISRKKIREKIDEYLEIFKLKEKRNVECGKLSRGMQQKVAICCAMIHEPRILFLDEPTLGLDVESVDSMEDIIKKIISKDRIIIITSHNLKFVSDLCNRITIIYKGVLVLDKDISFLESYSDNITYLIETQILQQEVKNNIYENFTAYMEESDNKTQIRITLKEDNEILEILNYLNSLSIKLFNIKKVNFELKDVFMDIIKGDDEKYAGININI
ncbi:ABC transporter ATP-binding protein [Caloranaerobacter ferrireducens]|uniref:ABC transporter ATP-binding protein n=1 Tax=Caloranaerobacter ferrireducens TaxID=1323370 RepID=UPI000A56C345|nr:ABC transporter ATP-binding protein [Caloranaerobacter ferrireducens]